MAVIISVAHLEQSRKDHSKSIAAKQSVLPPRQDDGDADNLLVAKTRVNDIGRVLCCSVIVATIAHGSGCNDIDIVRRLSPRNQGKMSRRLISATKAKWKATTGAFWLNGNKLIH